MADNPGSFSCIVRKRKSTCISISTKRGPMNGYMDGNIYGVWYVVAFDIKDDKQASITIANDLGSEDQKLTLTQNSDSTYQLKFLGYNAVKRAQGKKLVKIPSEMKMIIKK